MHHKYYTELGFKSYRFSVSWFRVMPEKDRAEENRIKELKARYVKKGLNFNAEEAKYQAKLAAQEAKAEKKNKKYQNLYGSRHSPIWRRLPQLLESKLSEVTKARL